MTAADGLVVVELTLAIGFLAAGLLTTGIPVPRRRRGSSGSQQVPGLLFLGGACMVLLGPLARTQLGAEWPAGLADGAPVTGVFVILVGLLRIPARVRLRTVLALADGLVAAAGLGTGLTAAAGRTDIATVTGLVGGICAVAAGWAHLEVAGETERRRLLWLALGAAGSLTVLTVTQLARWRVAGAEVVEIAPATPSVGTVTALAAAAMLPLPVAAVVAIRDPGAVNVHTVLARIVVGFSMVGLSSTTFAGMASGYELAAGRAPDLLVQGLIALAIAVAYHPVRGQVREIVEELLFGGRTDPVDALARIGDELASGSSPQAWLRALRHALAVPAVELRTADGTTTRSGTDPGTGTETTELRLGDETVGHLMAWLPPGQVHLPAPTRTVLALAAGPLAQAVHATRLATQLRTSHSHVLTVLEEERRRMRRDLHDGLGPTLTGVAYGIDAATNLIGTDPNGAQDLLRAVRADTANAIAEIRRIVDDLRPKALDELGLVAAVRQTAARLRTPRSARLRLDVTAPAPLPDLPAAVEVVAYRVAVEAVTNIARHADVDHASLQIDVQKNYLLLEVQDGGTSATPWTPGTGLTGMRERVEQIGGVLTITTTPGRNRVTARIPLQATSQWAWSATRQARTAPSVG